jgi:signal transduction histidine kinase
MQPAAVAFRVLRPVWMRGWFVALPVSGLGLMLFATHRYRSIRLLELERLRLRIASDLHNEIGSGLSQIAILSEVAQRSGEADRTLPRIADISRELVDSIGDMVWSIHPARDTFGDLIQRMRRSAGELFGGAGIQLTFEISGRTDDPQIGLDLRRQFYLIFREAVRNVVRHSHCTHVHVRIAAEAGWLKMRIADDGVGFDSAGVYEGLGLQNMRRRAKSLGGRIDFRWGPECGTVVEVVVPLNAAQVKQPHLNR